MVTGNVNMSLSLAGLLDAQLEHQHQQGAAVREKIKVKYSEHNVNNTATAADTMMQGRTAMKKATRNTQFQAPILSLLRSGP